ncbi:MAG: hypothetical protein IJC50_07870 [Clostridia bacterium]|nr:hypothetical protein [Clostridia bacterium]
MENNEFGELVVNVKSGNGAFGIPDASVTVYNLLSNGERNLISVLRTNSSGATQVIKLPSLSKAGTLTPGVEGDRAARYFIKTEKEGFYSVENDFVPIYSGVRAVQNVELVPVIYGTEFELPENDRIIDENYSPDL